MGVPGKILIVDDISTNREILKEIFLGEYSILEAENGKKAIALVHNNIEDISIILLDLMMPVMNGFEFITEMRRLDLLGKIPIVVITIADNTENELAALDMGAADIIGKPFEPNIVKKRVHNVIDANQSHTELERITIDLSSRLQRSNAVMVDMLSSVVENRSLEQNHHVIRIREFTRIILEELIQSNKQYKLNQDKIDTIVNAAALHDIGKIIIPDAILNRQSALSSDEFEIYKSHTTEGSKIIKQFGYIHQKEYIKYACEIAEFHHERFDGKGYPKGLSGEEIPIAAQVVGLADVYDSLTCGQMNGFGYSPQQAIYRIENGDCGVFSPNLISVLKSASLQLKEIEQMYKDSEDYELDNSRSIRQAWSDMNLETYRLDYLKYLTTLRMLDCTAVEVDPESGYYSIVYPKNPIYNKVGREGDFQKEAVVFIENYVHPSMKQQLQKVLQSFTQKVNENNFNEDSGEFQLYDEKEKRYVWNRITYVRVNAYGPKNTCVLIIIRNIQKQKEAEDYIKDSISSLS